MHRRTFDSGIRSNLRTFPTVFVRNSDKAHQVNIIELLPGLRGRACVLFPPFAGCDNYSHPNGLKWWNPPKLGLARTKKYGFTADFSAHHNFVVTLRQMVLSTLTI